MKGLGAALCEPNPGGYSFKDKADKPARPHRYFVVAVLSADSRVERWRTFKSFRMAHFHARRNRRAGRLTWIERGVAQATDNWSVQP